jgi:diguanylate cyclase (GGDEF)-like protein/PAS domain S-box-containing protein
MAVLDNPEVFRAIVDGLHVAVYLVDRDRKILFWNAGAEQISGYLRHEVIGKSCHDGILMHSDENGVPLCGSLCPLLGTMHDGQPRETQIYLRHKMGYRIPVRVRAFPIHDEGGEMVGMAESFEKQSIATESDEHENSLAAHGCLDLVSRVPNREFTQSHLRESLALFTGHHLPFSVLCVQIDQLEQFRTKHGPEAASTVVRVVARGIKNTLGETGFVGRWTEDRLLVVMTDCGPTQLRGVAERIKRTVTGAEIRWWGDQLSVEVSFGTAIAEEGDSVEAMVYRAESSLQKARSESDEPTEPASTQFSPRNGPQCS